MLECAALTFSAGREHYFMPKTMSVQDPLPDFGGAPRSASVPAYPHSPVAADDVFAQRPVSHSDVGLAHRGTTGWLKVRGSLLEVNNLSPKKWFDLYVLCVPEVGSLSLLRQPGQLNPVLSWSLDQDRWKILRGPSVDETAVKHQYQFDDQSLFLDSSGEASKNRTFKGGDQVDTPIQHVGDTVNKPAKAFRKKSKNKKSLKDQASGPREDALYTFQLRRFEESVASNSPQQKEGVHWEKLPPINGQGTVPGECSNSLTDDMSRRSFSVSSEEFTENDQWDIKSDTESVASSRSEPSESTSPTSATTPKSSHSGDFRYLTFACTSKKQANEWIAVLEACIALRDNPGWHSGGSSVPSTVISAVKIHEEENRKSAANSLCTVRGKSDSRNGQIDECLRSKVGFSREIFPADGLQYVQPNPPFLRKAHIHNGMVIHELSDDGGGFSVLSTAMLMQANIEVVISLLLDVKNMPLWDNAVATARVVENLDEESDVVHITFQPMWVWPFWTAARDICILRKWRRKPRESASPPERPGTRSAIPAASKQPMADFAVFLESVVHPECPAQPGVVRAHLARGAHYVYRRPKRSEVASSQESTTTTLSGHSSRAFNPCQPLRHQPSSMAEGDSSCLVVSVVQVDPCGWLSPWPSFRTTFGMEVISRVVYLKESAEFEQFWGRPVWPNRKNAEASGGAILGGPALRIPEFESHSQVLRLSLENRRRSSSLFPDILTDLQLPVLDGAGNNVGESRGGDPALLQISRRLSLVDIGPEAARVFQSISSKSKKQIQDGDATMFDVRGKNYLSDSIKTRSEPAAFQLVAADLFEVNQKIHNIAERKDNRVQRLQEFAKAKGQPAPFTFVVHFQVPGPPMLSFVLYFQSSTDYVGLQCQGQGSGRNDMNSRVARTLWRFVNGDDSYRDARFKLIPSVVEGNYLVKRAVGATPAIIGKKLTQHYYKGESYFEVECDVSSSSVAVTVLKVVRSYVTKLTMDLAFLIEGKADDELPERILGVVRLDHMDLQTTQMLFP